MDPLGKAFTHARMKAIGVNFELMVVTLAIFDLGRLRVKTKKQKHEEIGGLVVFCQEV